MFYIPVIISGNDIIVGSEFDIYSGELLNNSGLMVLKFLKHANRNC